MNTSATASRSPLTSPFRLITARLIARCWDESDAPAFRRLLDRNDRHLRPFIPWMRHEPQSLEQTRARLAEYRRRFLAGEDFRYALLDRDEVLIGELMLSTRTGAATREVGYLIDGDRTGQGLATEAAAMGIKTAFEASGVDVVALHCAPQNEASCRIARKLGFQLAEVHPDHSEDSEGRLCDLMIWRLGAERYPETPAAQLPVQFQTTVPEPEPMD